MTHNKILSYPETYNSYVSKNFLLYIIHCNRETIIELKSDGCMTKNFPILKLHIKQQDLLYQLWTRFTDNGKRYKSENTVYFYNQNLFGKILTATIGLCWKTYKLSATYHLPLCPRG